MSRVNIKEIMSRKGSVIVNSEEQIRQIKALINIPEGKVDTDTDFYIRILKSMSSPIRVWPEETMWNGYTRALDWFEKASGNLVVAFENVDFNDFTLPEKWCVRPGRHIWEWYKDCIAKGNPHGWSFDGSDGGYYGSRGRVEGYFHYPVRSDNYHWDPKKDPEYTEITLEQFNKYVVNKGTKETTKVKPVPEVTIMGEKVEFIKKSIQFNDITLNLKDLEVIQRVLTLCKEKNIGLEMRPRQFGTIIKHYDNGEDQSPLKRKTINTIIKHLKDG